MRHHKLAWFGAGFIVFFAVAAWLSFRSPTSAERAEPALGSAGLSVLAPVPTPDNPPTIAAPTVAETSIAPTQPTPLTGAPHRADDRPAGEQLRPGAVPSTGAPFTTTTRLGAAVTGTLFRSGAPHAPLLVFMGEGAEANSEWSATLLTVRESRDYHLVVVTPPPVAVEKSRAVEMSRGVGILEAALVWAQLNLSGSVDGICLVGGGFGAAAAVLLAAERRDVLAMVAVSAPVRLGKFRLADASAALRGRQTLWLAARADERAAGAMKLARMLPLATATIRPGGARGCALLAGDRRARTSLAGWLFAVMPRVRR